MAKNLLLLMAAVGVSLGLGEAMSRLAGFRPYVGRLVTYQFDPVLGWKPRPSFRYHHSGETGSYFVHFNPDGLPASADDWMVPADRERPSVALVGDSFTEGYYLPYPQSPAALLSGRVPRQVLNFGVKGYSPDQYLLTARERLGSYNVSDIVVLFFPFNDIPHLASDRYLHYRKPLFGPSLDRPVNTPLVQEEPLLVSEHSALYVVLAKLYRRYLVPPPAEVDFDSGEMRRAVSMMSQIHRENPDASFLIYYVPSMDEFEAGPSLRRNLDLFQAACREQGVRCADPSQRFGADGNPLAAYNPSDRHFSARGAGMVADHLAELLATPSPERMEASHP